jgi:superfamily I DNA/RNA helicase
VTGHQLVEQLKQQQLKPFADMSSSDQRDLGDVYDLYQSALRQNNALDLDDLMSHAVALLQTPAVSTVWLDDNSSG